MRFVPVVLWLSVVMAVDASVVTNADSALNLLDSTDFFICEVAMSAMNGHYVLSDETASDPETSVFVRLDDTTNSDEMHDFRLFRHNGFWMLADFAAWPPTTHFRCDPTRRDVQGVDTMEACGMNLKTPPRVGYTATDPKNEPLELYAQDCTEPRATPRAEL